MAQFAVCSQIDEEERICTKFDLSLRMNEDLLSFSTDPSVSKFKCDYPELTLNTLYIEVFEIGVI